MTTSPQIIVNIDVPDLEAGIRFYADGLGFKERRTLIQGTVAELSAGSTMVYVIEKAEDSLALSKSDITRSYQPHWTPIHLDVLVDDIELARAKAVAAGAEAAPVSENEWGKLVSLRDPFGHGICLLQLSASGYDAVAD